jgi:hypothetical protein
MNNKNAIIAELLLWSELTDQERKVFEKAVNRVRKSYFFRYENEVYCIDDFLKIPKNKKKSDKYDGVLNEFGFHIFYTILDCLQKVAVTSIKRRQYKRKTLK